MLLTHFVVASLFITASISKPIQLKQQATLQIDHAITPNINQIPNPVIKQRLQNIDELDKYYTTIFNNVIDATISEIIETAPETFLTIHELQYAGREYCRVSSEEFMMVLQYQLDQRVRNNLMISFRPLVEQYNENDIIQFNRGISQKLGLILNPEQLSREIIQKVYLQVDSSQILVKIWKLITDKEWAETRHHERNESAALEAWLRSWLMDIEYALQDEFDSNIGSLCLKL